jgi:hypothetical protein
MRTQRYLSRRGTVSTVPSSWHVQLDEDHEGHEVPPRRCVAASPPNSPKIPSRNLTSSRQSLCGPCCLSGKKNDLRE